VGISLFLFFRSMSEKVALADFVIGELQKGNLKARFPIHRMDEMGQAMARFNKMADEIERLVEQLRNVERSRIRLLQDLAHDLRTPVASLKNLLSTLQKTCKSAEHDLQRELLSLSLQEVEYFERLIEDLLLLAQVSEPRYHADQDTVSVLELVESEADGLSARSETEKSGKEVSVEAKADSHGCLVSGDTQLLRRMFRNALENAYSFARSDVRVVIDSPSEDELRISIRDDGPGMSEEVLKSFGERRVSRALNKSVGNRLSVGLGSVIMRTVAEVHGGKVHARNRKNELGRVEGAEIQIILPRRIS
jgi:K+-sensing histidine kinase KdpD